MQKERGLVDRQPTACLLSGEVGIHISEAYDIRVSSTKGIPSPVTDPIGFDEVRSNPPF